MMGNVRKIAAVNQPSDSTNLGFIILLLMLTCRALTRAARAPTAVSLPVLAITASVRLLTSAPISGVIREALVTTSTSPLLLATLITTSPLLLTMVTLTLTTSALLTARSILIRKAITRVVAATTGFMPLMTVAAAELLVCVAALLGIVL